MINHFIKKLKMATVKSRTTAVVVMILCMTSLNGCGTVKSYSQGGFVMDTVFYATVYGDSVSPAELIEYGDALDTRMLSRFWDNTMVSCLNAGLSMDEFEIDPAGCGVTLDLMDLIDECDRISADSGGAFDVHLGALCDLWNIDAAAKGEEEFVLPSKESIEEARSDKSILDLGAVGKGIYLDLCFRVLEEKNAYGAVISAGGSVLVYGNKPNGKEFSIGIKDPSGESDSVGTIFADGGYFISTSGSYERYAEIDGIIFHHILNPGTGYPAWYDAKDDAPVPVSVTVIAKSGLVSDALSTACFVLGPNDGTGLADKYDAHVIYLMSDGTFITSHGIMQSDGKKPEFRIEEDA